MPNAGAAFRSALRALGESDCSDPTAPTLRLPAWTDERPNGEAIWIQAADAGVEYEARVNGGEPVRMALSKSHDQGAWQLETLGRLRAPAPPGSSVRLDVVGRYAGKKQTLVSGSYVAPEAVAFMGAPGHLVICSEDASGAADSHFFAHVLNIEGAGPTIVKVAAWCRIETE